MSRKGIPETVLVAPDAFKGTFTASEVAAAIGAGLTAAGRPVDLCPVADGGEGTLEVLTEPLGLERVEVEVTDPLGRPVRAAFGVGERPGARRPRAGGRVAVVELASASGLALVAESERDALAASSAGTGELIRASLDVGASTIYVAVGGSATTDGGVGALEEIGSLDGARLILLCDVATPFQRAAEVFGPQKGADPGQVSALAERLDGLAGGWARDPRGVAMTGAAGGFAGGLWSVLGAELRGGAAFVLEAVGFDPRMRAARAVVVGEGRLDRSTLAGKIAGEIATRARQSGVPAHAIVGTDAMDRFDRRILDLQVVREAGTLEQLEAAGFALSQWL